MSTTTKAAAAVTSTPGVGAHSSHDHIKKIQELTGGEVFVSQGKITKLRNFKTYAQALNIRGYRFEYFVNALFSPDLVDKAKRRDDPYAPVENQKREKKSALNPGQRHDLTLDFEKVKPDDKDKTKWIKDDSVTADEKAELMAVLEKLPYLAWAGVTPHGVHAGVYFDSLVSVADVNLLADWIWDEVQRNGYTGSIKMDEWATKNCNRPSRFLKSFGFWRPQANLGSAEIQSIKAGAVVKAPAAKGNLAGAYSKGSLADLAAGKAALFWRTYNIPADEIAALVGQPLSWVQSLFNKEPQKNFNAFNKDLGREIGPRSDFGRFLADWKFRSKKTLLYVNAALSWQWCWANKLSVAQAKTHVFSDPAFKEVLQEIEIAYNEAVTLNGRPQHAYQTSREWVERDIERCHKKYAGVTNAVLGAVDAAVRNVCNQTGNPVVTISQILPQISYQDSITQRALAVLGLTPSIHGPKSYWNVPMYYFFVSTDPNEILPDPSDNTFNIEFLAKIAEHSPALAEDLADAFSDEDLPSAPVAPVAPVKIKRQKKPALPRGKKLKPMDAVLETTQVSRQIPGQRVYVDEKELRRRLDADDSFRGLASRADLAYKRSIRDKNPFTLPPRDLAVELVRAWMTSDGHVYFSGDHLYSLLRVLYLNDWGTMLHWFLYERLVLDVSSLVPEQNVWFGWGDYVRGELRFGWRVLEQGQTGSVEVITGAPGTGKTKTLADELIAARKLNCRVGSATHLSAHQLRQRVKGKPEVTTIHEAYNIRPNVQKKRLVTVKADFFAGDEIGQIDADVAGLMAACWAPGKRVLMTVGPGQNQPVGPGLVGEDLVNWLRRNPNVTGVKLTPLLKNYRTDGLLGKGIVDFFDHVHLGKLPQSLGPGMEVHFLSDERRVIQKAADTAAPLNDFMAFAPTHKYAFRVNTAINRVKRTAAGFPNTTVMDFLKGEEMVVVEPGIKARSHGLSRGRVVTVYQNTTVSGNPTDEILVSFDTPLGKRVGNLTLDEVDWKYCRTGHSTQGMECDTGIVVLLPSQVTTRRWLYTAVSRCKQRCVLVCQKKDLIDCLDNDAERRTLLPVILDKAKAHWDALNGMPKGSRRSRK